MSSQRLRPRTRIVVRLFAALLLAVFAAAVSGAGPSSAVRGTKFAFINNADSADIWLANADGTGRRRLTRGDAIYFTNPVWSPPGDRIVYRRRAPEEINYVEVINVDGSGWARLAAGSDPVWSPDGNRVAFVGNVKNRDGTETREVFAINADGTGLRRLTRLSELPGEGGAGTAQVYDDSPALLWAPGQEILFSFSQAGPPSGPAPASARLPRGASQPQTRVLYWDGTTFYDQTQCNAWLRARGFSAARYLSSRPRAKAIYSTLQPYIASDYGNLHAVNAATATARQLTRNRRFPSFAPAWSPDGRRIAFSRSTANVLVEEIYVMNRDGSGQKRHSTSFLDGAPSWSPDGKKLLFSRVDGEKQVAEGAGAEIFVMDSDGRAKRQLTHNPADDTSPEWTPDGRICFVRSSNAWSERVMVMNADGTGQRQLGRQSLNADYPIWQPIGG
jgi:Tol biopolymer transport system component